MGLLAALSNLAAVLGAIILLFVLFVAGPIGLFFAGALWSALFGWLQSDAAETPIASAGGD